MCQGGGRGARKGKGREMGASGRRGRGRKEGDTEGSVRKKGMGMVRKRRGRGCQVEGEGFGKEGSLPRLSRHVCVSASSYFSVTSLYYQILGVSYLHPVLLVTELARAIKGNMFKCKLFLVL